MSGEAPLGTPSSSSAALAWRTVPFSQPPLLHSSTPPRSSRASTLLPQPATFGPEKRSWSQRPQRQSRVAQRLTKSLEGALSFTHWMKRCQPCDRFYKPRSVNSVAISVNSTDLLQQRNLGRLEPSLLAITSASQPSYTPAALAVKFRPARHYPVRLPCWGGPVHRTTPPAGAGPDPHHAAAGVGKRRPYIPGPLPKGHPPLSCVASRRAG